jgi:diguanylate cyclase (GGDEF)-like protein/PAS domain S-box-containing protein
MPAMRKKSLRRQLQRAFLLMLVPLVVVTAVGGALLRTSHEQKDSTSQRVSSAVVITDVLTRLAESGRTLSSLILLRQRGPLVAYLAIAPALDRDFARVVAAASPEAVPSGRIALAAWRNLWRALQGVEYRTRGPALRIDHSVLVLFAQVAENAVISSQHLDQIADSNARELQRLLDSGLRREQLQELLLLLSAALGIVAGVAAAHRLHRRVRRQLDDLSAAAARLGSDPDPAPVPLGETSELRVVGEAFNEMLQRVTDGRAQLADSERRFRSLVQNSSDVIVLVDPDTVIRYLSPSARPVIGVDPDTYPGRPLSDLLDPQDVPMMLDALLHARHGSSLPAIDCRLAGANGSPVPTETLIVDLTADPAVAGFVLTSRDVRERRGLEDQLRHQAFHDELTGLPNRALLRERLSHRLSRRTASTDALVAVLFIDLDDFKTINDSLGHSAGDSLLRTIGHRISGKLRPADTAARVGGDEFIVLLEDLTDRAEAHTVAARLLTEVRQPVTLYGRDVFPQASLGIAIVPPQHVGPEEVLAQADMAMYHAKADAGGIAEYQPVLAEQVRRRLALKTELQQAIDRHEFELHYQPVIDLDRRQAVGAEALVRWRHPERGLLLPAEFLPVCEESEMILSLGTWVLQEACRQAAAWAESRGWEGVSVNVPVRHVIRPGFPRELTALLAESHLPAHQLVLELTESALAHEQDRLSERLQAVREIGVRLAIDDFGREYSSLNRLRHLTVDILKIDKSLVDEVDTGGRDAAIAGAIIDLSSALGLDTVAEGVERPEQADALQSLRCARAQGFFFSRPVPPTELTVPATRPAPAFRSS